MSDRLLTRMLHCSYSFFETVGGDMPTDYLKVLEAKRAEVDQSLGELRNSLAKLAEDVNLKEAQLRNLDELLRLERPSRPLPGRRAQIGPVGFLDAAEMKLRDGGRPMHYQELAKGLQADGIYIPGKNPAANLLTQMIRDGRFKKTGRGTYALIRPKRNAGDGTTDD